MDESSLPAAYAPDRDTRRQGAPIAPKTGAPKSLDHNKNHVEKNGCLTQECHDVGSYPATYPQGRRTEKDRVRRPQNPVPSELREPSIHTTKDTCSEHSYAYIRLIQPPEPVDQVALPVCPIKSVPTVNGPSVTERKQMEPFPRSDYDSTGIPNQQEVPSAARATPPPEKVLGSNSHSSLVGSPSQTTPFKSLSKKEENQLYTLLERIRRLREIIWALRSQVQEQRFILRSKQNAKAAADDKYIQLARLQQTRADKRGQFRSREGKTLQELLQDCENVRSEYGPLEDQCNALEDELGSQEFELTRLEKNFVAICSLAIPPQSRSPSYDMVLEGVSEGSSAEEPQSFHPLVAEWLSKLGDVDIFRERHERHREEKAALEADKETRQLVNLLLAPEDEAWLQEWDKLEQEILSDLKVAQTEAEELRKKCLAAGLLDENGEPKDFPQENEAFVDDVDAKGQKSEYLKYPTLLPQPGTTDTKFKASAPRPGEQSGSAGDHINQWLLHSLRSSPLDVYQLAKTFQAEFGDFKSHQWQSDVRNYWYKDGAIKDETGYRIDSITNDSPLYGISNLTKHSIEEENIEPVLGITGRKVEFSDTSSVSGSELDRDDGGGVDPLPRSKYEGR